MQPAPGTTTAPSSPPSNFTPWWRPRPFSNQTLPSACTTLQPGWAHRSLVFSLRSWHCLHVQRPRSELALNPNLQALLPGARLHTCVCLGAHPDARTESKCSRHPAERLLFPPRSFGHSTSAVLHDTVSLSGCDVEGSSEIWGEKRIVIPKFLNETYQIKITKLLVNPTNFTV